jgi:hypothetical protein
MRSARYSIVAALALSATPAAAAGQFESPKTTPAVVVQGNGFSASKTVSGVVVQGNALDASKLATGAVVQGAGFEATKMSIGIVVQSVASGGIVIRAPLTHW